MEAVLTLTHMRREVFSFYKTACMARGGRGGEDSGVLAPACSMFRSFMFGNSFLHILAPFQHPSSGFFAVFMSKILLTSDFLWEPYSSP